SATSAAPTSSGRAASRKRHGPSSEQNHCDLSRTPARAPAAVGNGQRVARMGRRLIEVCSGDIQVFKGPVWSNGRGVPNMGNIGKMQDTDGASMENASWRNRRNV